MKKRIIDFIKKNIITILVITAIIFEVILYVFTPHIEKIIVHICTLTVVSITTLYLLLNGNKDFKKDLFLLVFIIGLLVRTIYIFKTSIYERQHDVQNLFEKGHLDYIYTLFTTHRLPTTNIWQFYHPPLWHFIGALWLWINKLFKIELFISLEGLQILSLLLSLFTIIIANSICIKLKIKDKYRYIVDLFFATHLSLVILSGSVNNDCLLLFLEMLTILVLINFNENENWKNTIYLAIVTGLCVMTKISGAVMAIPIMYIFIKKFIYYLNENKDKLKIYINKIIAFGLISLTIGLWYQVRNLILFGTTAVPEPSDWLYVGNHSIISRFFTINIHELFNYANTDSNYNLPSFIIISSLFGEFTFDRVYMLRYILISLNLILIFISMLFMIKYIIKDRKNIVINILIITWLSFIISAYIFNYKYPYACSMDFRYITICLLPGVVIIYYELQKIKNKFLNIFIQLLSYLFIISSILFTIVF